MPRCTWELIVPYHTNVSRIYGELKVFCTTTMCTAFINTIKPSVSFYFFHSGSINILSFSTMSWITQINIDSWKEKKSSTYGFSKEEVLKHISSPKNIPSRQVWFSKMVARNSYCCCDGKGYRLVGITKKEEVKGNFEQSFGTRVLT